MARLFTTYRLPGEWNKLTLGGGVNWQLTTWSSVPIGDGSVTARQNAYAIYNLMARYDFTSRLSAQLNLNNLFDKKYVAYGGFGADFYNPGREITATLRRSW